MTFVCVVGLVVSVSFLLSTASHSRSGANVRNRRQVRRHQLTDHIKRLVCVNGRFKIGAAVALAIVIARFVGFCAALILISCGAIGLFSYRRWKITHHRDQIEVGVIEWVEQLAYRQRAGVGLAAALVDSHKDAPVVLRNSLQELKLDVDHGIRLENALSKWARKLNNDSAHRVTVAFSVALTSGGEVSDSCLRLVESLRRRRRLRDEVKALSSQARSSMYVLVLLPLIFGMTSSMFDAGARQFLFDSLTGMVVLAVGIAFDLVGALWMSRICRVAP